MLKFEHLLPKLTSPFSYAACHTLIAESLPMTWITCATDHIVCTKEKRNGKKAVKMGANSKQYLNIEYHVPILFFDHCFGCSLLFDLLLAPLGLFFLLPSDALFHASVFAVKHEARRHVPALVRVRIVNRLSRSFHSLSLISFQLFSFTTFCRLNLDYTLPHPLFLS